MEFTEGGGITSKVLLLAFLGLFSIGDSSGQSQQFENLGVYCLPHFKIWLTHHHGQKEKY